MTPSDQSSTTQISNRSSDKQASSMATVPELPTEILQIIGRHIESRPTLNALTKVCRNFQTIFTPFLYVNCVMKPTFLEPLNQGLDFVPVNRCLQYVTGISVDVGVARGLDYHHDLSSIALQQTEKCMEVMPKLQSFRWGDGTQDPGILLIDQGFLDFLSGRSSLQHLSIQFPDHLKGKSRLESYRNLAWRTAWNSVDMGKFVYNGFDNLTSLELYNLHHEKRVDGPEQLSDKLASALLDCPHLTTLGLGLACPWDSGQHAYNNAGFLGFLTWLCQDYRSYEGSKPLSLHTLRLGYGFTLYWDSAIKLTTGHNYLSDLLDFQCLKVFHIFNGPVCYGEVPSEAFPSDWDLLHSETGLTLQELSITNLSNEVLVWLYTSGISLKELIITHQSDEITDTGTSAPQQFASLLPQGLSMLYARQLFVFEPTSLQNEKNDNPGTHGMPEVEVDYEKDSALLHGSMLSMYGAQLTRLGISFDFTQWDNFKNTLIRLIQLTQLRLEPDFGVSIPYAQPHASRWPGLTESTDIARRYAQLCAWLRPSLRYVKIGDQAWRVLLGSGRPDPEVDFPETFIELQLLDKDEMRGIELFAIADTTYQSGLVSYI